MESDDLILTNFYLFILTYIKFVNSFAVVRV